MCTSVIIEFKNHRIQALKVQLLLRPSHYSENTYLNPFMFVFDLFDSLLCVSIVDLLMTKMVL